MNTVDKGLESGALEDNYRGVQKLEGREVQFWSFDPTASKMILANQRRFDNARTGKKGKKNY